MKLAKKAFTLFKDASSSKNIKQHLELLIWKKRVAFTTGNKVVQCYELGNFTLHSDSELCLFAKQGGTDTDSDYQRANTTNER